MPGRGFSIASHAISSFKPLDNEANWLNSTFEVNSRSTTLKPAELNTQLLPILVDRAIQKSEMIKAIEQILVEGLTETLRSQQEAMKNPLACRKWIQDTNSYIGEKVDLGYVSYTAGLPTSQSERMNLLIHSGFHPMKLPILTELIRKYFEQRCEDLKEEMKITVPHSTYTYMVPDFAGVLEPDEVYLHPSQDISAGDFLSPQSGFPFRGVDLLVARLPAHFASDIQKVKTVFKEELFGLRDVIVFSTKGNPSLAAKL
jgi:hypothetical protein